MKLWLFPIEPFEERYTAQWLRWFQRPEFVSQFDAFQVISPVRHGGIKHGEFLDVYGTNTYKAEQLAEFARMMENNQIGDGDVVLVLDAWNPAVLQLAYMRDAGPRDFRVVGLLHAGTWDPHDFLAKKLQPRWVKPAEAAMMNACDRICVATEFHRELIFAAVTTTTRICVTGFPLYKGEFIDHSRPWHTRDPLVVFPHRLAPEKDPKEFEFLELRFRELYPDAKAEFVRSRDVCKSKDEYYALLGRARAAVSTAWQETWGIAMLEASMLGAYPIVPNRLSYPELYKSPYVGLDMAAEQIHQALYFSGGREFQYNDTRERSALGLIAGVCKEAFR